MHEIRKEYKFLRYNEDCQLRPYMENKHFSCKQNNNLNTN